MKNQTDATTGKTPGALCPNCQREHPKGEYEGRQSDEHDIQHQPGTTVFCPPDVPCPCGATLRYTVPLFRTTELGWHWRIIIPAGVRFMDPNNPRRVLIEVYGGVAEVTKCPPDVEACIVDHDNHDLYPDWYGTSQDPDMGKPDPTT